MFKIGKFDRLLSLNRFNPYPVYVYVDYLDGKSKRYRYDSIDALYADRNNPQFDFVVVDDCFGQKSLLTNAQYLMVYCHEE